MIGDDPRARQPRSAAFTEAGIVSSLVGGKANLRWRGELPHLEKEGGTYFVTFCLAGAPRGGGRRVFTPDDDAVAVARASEPAESGSGARTLVGRAGALVEEALLHFSGERYGLHAWCVMPNHVHVLTCPFGEHRLPAILHSWKSFTAKAIARATGWPGGVWEREYFDHLVRSPAALDRFVRYTEMNPVEAGLCVRPEDWPLSSARFPR
jgi:REP element-mobilizing transposase RayT